MGKDEDREPKTELAKTDDATLLMRPVAPIKALLEAQAETVEFIKKGLHAGVDYGSLPGGDREVLFKAGAERLCSAFGVSAEYRITEQEIDHDRKIVWTKRRKKWYTEDGRRRFNWEEEDGESLGFYRYVVAVTLTSRETGALLGTGIGVCSTMESKYVDRPRELENTILKMAQKRAMVGAALNVFCLSDRFTQDMEEGAESEAVAKAPDIGEDAATMTANQAAAWAKSIVGLSDEEFAGLKVKAAGMEISWLFVCRAARALNGKDAIPEQIEQAFADLVAEKYPDGIPSDQIEAHAPGEAPAPSVEGAATETETESPVEPAGTIRPDIKAAQEKVVADAQKPKDDGSGEPSAKSATARPASASAETISPAETPEPANWLERVVSRETYVELRSKAADAGVVAHDFIDDPLAEIDDPDMAELRFKKWLNTAIAEKEKAAKIEAAQDARGGA